MHPVLASAVAMLLLGSACGTATSSSASAIQPHGTSMPTGASIGECRPLPPLGSMPERFPDIEIPNGAVALESVGESVGRSHRGRRLDLFVPLSVRETYRFFRDQARAARHQIIFEDFEGFEAEVFMVLDKRRVGLVQARVTCHEGSIVTIKIIPRESASEN